MTEYESKMSVPAAQGNTELSSSVGFSHRSLELAYEMRPGLQTPSEVKWLLPVQNEIPEVLTQLRPR